LSLDIYNSGSHCPLCALFAQVAFEDSSSEVDLPFPLASYRSGRPWGQCGLVISMGLKLPPDQLALYRGIDEILWRDWDPIGVSQLEDSPRDEYYGYLPQVFQLALRAAPATEIAEYLRQVTVERIGLAASLQTELPVAERIRALKLSLIPE